MNDFYDQLAPYFHLIYEDWDKSIAFQAEMLHNIIQNEWGSSAKSILDVSCGIGTQSIGLASLKYQVTASDNSPKAVSRAIKEAEARNLSITFSIRDMRDLETFHSRGFDVVICAGNSIPHLLSAGEILGALKEMYACIRSGGGCILTIRQYDNEERGKGLFKPFGIREERDTRYIIFQVWDFEGEQYNFSMYFVQEDQRSKLVETLVLRSRYYAISPNHLLNLMEQAGFEDVKRLDDNFTHPAIIVGTRKA
jgi:SAM-dependent methyltransferase